MYVNPLYSQVDFMTSVNLYKTLPICMLTLYNSSVDYRKLKAETTCMLTLCIHLWIVETVSIFIKLCLYEC